jgi:AraC-like DNA-binding protein
MRKLVGFIRLPGVTKLRWVDSPAALLADPIGSAISGSTFVLWVQSPERLGAMHVGSYDARDAETITALFPLFDHPALAPQYDILHDLGDLRSLDTQMFAFFEKFLRGWIDVLVRRVRRVAAVRPEGLIGGALAGLFHDWVAPRLAAQLCDDRSAAYAWLGLADAEVGELEAARDAIAGPTTLRRVRDAIEQELEGASLASLATRLGVGTRTLQRQLQLLGTSFRDEVARVRIEVAKRRLLDTDDKVAAIARTVGFASNASFSAAFLKVVGVPPSMFRVRRAS